MMGKKVHMIWAAVAAAILISATASAQWPYAPPAPPSAPPPLPPSAPYSPQPQAVPQPAPPAAQPQYPAHMQQQQAPQAQQSQERQEYAFRPDLTNQQYGQCLGLEKNWRTLWQQYAQGYQQAQTMSPQDPRYAQMSYYLADLKRRLDAAWYQFSSQCIYFPSQRRR